MIPPAQKIRDFQAPSAEKLVNRAETQWRIVLSEGIKAIAQTQRTLEVPIMGETEEMVKEAITILTEKELGYTYNYRFLDKLDDDKWTTGYLTFEW